MRKRAQGLLICGYGLKKRRYGLQNVSARIGYSLVWFINPWARFVKPREQFKNSWVRFINWGDELQNCHHRLFVFFYRWLPGLLTNLTKMKNNLFIISAQERLGVVSKLKEIYQYRHRPKWVEKYQLASLFCFSDFFGSCFSINYQWFQ